MGDRRPRIGDSQRRRSSDGPQRPQSNNNELRRAFNRQQAEQPASAPSSEGMREPQEQHANTSCNDLVINFLRSIARRKTNSGARASDIQPVSEQDNEEVEQEKLNKILDKIVNKYKVKEGVYNQEKIRKKILEMMKGEIEKGQGNKWDKAQTLVARITCYESPHNGLYTAIAEDARNLMNLEGGIIYQHGVTEYAEVKKVTNEIRQYLKNWLRSNPEVNRERQNARDQFNNENWQREQEAEARLAVENPSIVIQMRNMRHQMHDDIYHAPRQIMEQRRPEQGREQRRPEQGREQRRPEQGREQRRPEQGREQRRLEQIPEQQIPERRPEQGREQRRPERRLEQIPEQQQTPLQRFRQNILRRLCLDPSQPEQRLSPQWHGQQRPEQQRHRQQRPEQRRERQAQLQRWKRSILRRLCGSTEQVDLGAMKPAQLHKYAQGLEQRVQRLGLDQPMRSGTVLGQRERRKLEQCKQKADNLHQRVNYLSRQGSLVGSGLQYLDNAAIIATKVTLSIDNRLLKNLEQQLPEGTTPGQLDQTRLGQLRQESEQLRQRQRINQTLLPEQFQPMPRGEQDQRSPRQLMRDFRRQDNEIKDKADEIITKLRRLELPTMNPEQLNQYARELEQEVPSDLQRRTNLGQREQRRLEQLMTRVLDIQKHVQQQLENRQDGVDRRYLESAKRKASRSIQRGLPAMNPEQLHQYAQGLKQEVGNLPERTNLGEQNRGELEQLEEKAWQLRKEIDQRRYGLPQDMSLISIWSIADWTIQSTGNHLSKLERRKLRAMDPVDLNQHARDLEQEVRTNLGQREPRKLEKLQKKAWSLMNEVTQRLESEPGQPYLESARRKASKSIELISR